MSNYFLEMTIKPLIIYYKANVESINNEQTKLLFYIALSF